MWELLELLFAIDSLRENRTTVQLLCMLAIVVVIIVCSYMAFGQGQYIWLAGGAVVVLILGLVAVLLGRSESV